MRAVKNRILTYRTVKLQHYRPSRQVQLSERLQASVLPADRKTHPARKSRSAELVLRCAQVTLKRHAKRNSDGQSPKSITLNVVDVSEVNVPSGEPPVRWTLATTEPVDSEAACWRIVDLYRSRWLVEEFFKAIKTGCGFRFRQLDSYKTLLVALGLCVPVAWTLLLMRYLAREAPDSPAEAVLPPALLGFLKRVWLRGPAPEQPTVREAQRAIAALGGHIRHNGSPGWLVLHRGYEQLLLIYQGFCAVFPALLTESWVALAATCSSGDVIHYKRSGPTACPAGGPSGPPPRERGVSRGPQGRS